MALFFTKEELYTCEVLIYQQGARLLCNQCSAPLSIELLLLLRVQVHSCQSNTSPLECSRMFLIVLSLLPARLIVMDLAEGETRLILLVNKDSSMATEVWQLAETCQML